MWLITTAFASITLFLNDPIHRTAPSSGCTAAHCRALLAEIEHAERSIDFAVYGFRSQPDIVDALVAARARGVRVRGFVDADAEGRNYYADTEDVHERLGDLQTDEQADRLSVASQRTFSLPDRCQRPAGFAGPLQCLSFDVGDQCLMAAHASREPITSTGDILHHKFFVFDERRIWTGSTNVSDSGTGGYNANLVVVIDNPKVASWYVREVEQMDAGRFHKLKQRSPLQRTILEDGTHITALFSPQDRPIQHGVRPLLQQAEHSIDIAVFFLTHKHVTADLIAAHRRGVRVRVLLDATAATNGYTKHTLLRAAGIAVKVEDWGGKMHAKAALVDGHTLIAGSMNWTSAGEGGNDENTLLIRSTRLGKTYEAWFERLWADVDDRWLRNQPAAESYDSPEACHDGVDNDFDHLADGADAGCSPTPPAARPLPGYRFVDKREGEGQLIKGVELAGRRVFLQPSHPDYGRTRPNRWFCNRFDALAQGYRRIKGRRAR